MPEINWTPVEEAVAADTLPGFKLALLESAKILEQRLREERLPGRTPLERLESARFHLTKPEQLHEAYEQTNALRFRVSPELTKQKAKDYVQAYRQGVADLNTLSQSRDSLASQAKLYLGLLKGKQRWLLRGLVGLGVFFIGVLILADTPPGQLLVAGIVTLVHVFFGWIVTLLILLGILVAVVLGTAVYLDRRSTVRIKDEEA